MAPGETYFSSGFVGFHVVRTPGGPLAMAILYKVSRWLAFNTLLTYATSASVAPVRTLIVSDTQAVNLVA